MAFPKTTYRRPDIPLRPIASAYGDKLDKITWLLEQIASQLLDKVLSHLRSTEDYLQRLNLRYPDSYLLSNSIVFSRGAESESESELESPEVVATSQKSESESIKLPRLRLRNVLFESEI